MKAAFIIVSLIASASLLTACGGRKLEVMKSPCAGAEESPCGPKRPANEWMHQKQGQPTNSGFLV